MNTIAWSLLVQGVVDKAELFHTAQQRSATVPEANNTNHLRRRGSRANCISAGEETHIQYKWQTLLIGRPDFRTIECKESDPHVTAKVGSIVSVGSIDWNVWSWTLTVSLLVKSCYSADCVQRDLVCRIPAVQIVRWNLSFVRNSEDLEVMELESSPNIMGSDPVFESAMGILEGRL